VATGQIGLGDLVQVGLDDVSRRLVFSKKSGGALIQEIAPAVRDEAHVAARSGSVGLPIPQVKESKAARKSQGRGEKSEG